MKGTVLVLAALATVALAQSVHDPLCVGVANGGFIPFPDRCSGWLQCANDLVHREGDCAAPLVFVAAKGGCSYAEGDCADFWSRTTLPPPTTTEMPLTNVCTKGKIYYEAHSHHCNKYVLCYNGDARLQECADGFEFSVAEGSCVAAADSGCEPNRCPAEDTVDPTYLPNNKDCTAYYICLNGQPVAFSCSGEYVFDILLNTCNNRDVTDVAHCEAGTTAPPGF